MLGCKFRKSPMYSISFSLSLSPCSTLVFLPLSSLSLYLFPAPIPRSFPRSLRVLRSVIFLSPNIEDERGDFRARLLNIFRRKTPASTASYISVNDRTSRPMESRNRIMKIVRGSQPTVGQTVSSSPRKRQRKATYAECAKKGRRS